MCVRVWFGEIRARAIRDAFSLWLLTEDTAIALSLVTNLCDGGTSVKAFHMMIMPEKPESKFTYHATHLVGLLS